MNTNKLRMPLDILMTILSVILMGGTMLFPDDRMHQICGIALVVMWAIHIILNRRWYGSLFKGKYQPFRIMQLVVNCGVLICALLLMISGVWKYMFGLQQFFFFDFERGYVLFTLDYISILVLFATVLHYVRKGVVAMGAPCRPQRSEDGER